MEIPTPENPILFLRWSLSVMFVLAILSCERLNNEAIIPILYTGEIVEITDTGTVFTGFFKNVDPDQVTEYGFLWGTTEIPLLDNSTKYVLPLPFQKDFFQFTNNSSLAKNTTYFVRIFVTYEDSYTYYGKTVSFFSLGSKPPLILDVTPLKACFGDTIEITGKYFGHDSTSKHVYFGEDPAGILYSNDTLLRVQVPHFSSRNSYNTTDKVTIKLIREGFPSARTELFDLAPPRVTSYSPKKGNSYTNITVFGSGFHPQFTELTIGEHQCKILQVENRSIQALLPSLFVDYEDSLRVEVANRSRTLGKVKVLAPNIQRVSPDTVFSYEYLKLYGENLDIENLDILINDKSALIIATNNDSLLIEVPGNLCTDKLELKIILGQDGQDYSEPIIFRQPQINEILTVENQLFNGKIIIKGNYFPEVAALQNVRLNGLKHNYSYDFGKDVSFLNMHVRNDVVPDNEWLSASLDFCPSTRVEIDSAFHIPSPIIHEVSDTMYSLSAFTIQGDNFNTLEYMNQIFLGETFIQDRKAGESGLLSFSVPYDIEAGTYPLKVVTNGQESNVADVELVHRWNKLSSLPERIGEYGVFMLQDNELYIGGGSRSNSSSFYSFDLLTKEWKNKAPLPIKYGLSYSDGTNGYVYGENKLYKYDFNADQWTLLSEKEINYTTGFLYDNKLFVLQVGVNQPHYYFDLGTNSWVTFSGYSGPVRALYYMHSVVGDGEAYLFHDWDVFILDLSDLSITDTGASQLPATDKSRVGFEYEGEAYVYGKYSQFEIWNIQDFRYRTVGGPTGYQVNLIRDGSKVFLLNSWELWTFDLTLQ